MNTKTHIAWKVTREILRQCFQFEPCPPLLLATKDPRTSEVQWHPPTPLTEKPSDDRLVVSWYYNAHRIAQHKWMLTHPEDAEALSPDNGPWPEATELAEHEERLAEEALELLLTNTRIRARRTIRQTLNVNDIEAEDLINLAHQLAEALTEEGQQTQRAMAILQSEEIADEARKNLDLRAQITALKQAHTIMGLTRDDPNSPAEALISAIRNTTKRVQNDARPTPPGLPSAQAAPREA